MPPQPALPSIAPASPQHDFAHAEHSNEFAEGPGKSIARNPNSPSGQFGMPVQMQQAPDVIQRKPSEEVPDLEEDVIDKVNTALQANDRQKALDLMLAALVAKDPATFNKDFLVSNKLHVKRGGDSLTEIGPSFQKWLTEQLAKGPKEIKKDKKACQTYLDTLKVPVDKPDIKISIAKARFKSASVLYSVIRHEFTHYQQIKNNPLEYIPTSEWPAGYANPGKKSVGKAREVEAYLWEAENMAITGIATDPQFVWNKFEMLNSSMRGALSSMVGPLKARWKAALANLFKVALDGFIKQAEELITEAADQPMDEATFKELEAMYVYVDDLWDYKGTFRAEAATLEDRQKKLQEYIEATKASTTAAKFPDALVEASKDFKTVKKDFDAYNVWRPLYDKWKELSPKYQTQFAADYEKVMVPIWTSAFDMLDATMTRLHSADKEDSRLTGLANNLLHLLNRTDHSKIPAKTKAAKTAILEKWKKELGLS